MRQESDANIRCFIAVPIPPEVKQQIVEVVNEIKNDFRGAKWVKPDSHHVTLKFLGEIPRERVHVVRETLLDELEYEKFYLNFSGLGVFPNPRKARVLWAGMKDESSSCQKIAASIDDMLGRKEFPREKRKFKGHLTLARFRNPGPVPEKVFDKEFKTSVFEVDTIKLFKSELLPQGARYTMIEEFPATK